MLLIVSLVVTLLINFFLFLIAFRRQSDKLTDFAYSLSFISVTVVALSIAPHHSPLLYILSAMVLLWALRLGSFLVYRIRKSGKDNRFDKMRTNFAAFLKFWLGQGVVAWLLLLPLLMVASNTAAVSYVSIIGLAVWAVGLIIETVADQQKYAFKQSPNNKSAWIDTGLWSYSRHPNYFGEICVWIGLYVASLAGLHGIEKLIGIISPLAITVSLLFVSGIPILEKSADKRWGNDKNYQAYKRRTSILLPLWHKK